MSEDKKNPESTENQPSKKVENKKAKKAKKDGKKMEPLWLRFIAFCFSLLIAGVLIYDIYLDAEKHGKNSAEAENRQQEFLMLQDRVAQLEQTIKIGSYFQGGGNEQLKKDLEIIFQKIGELEESTHASTNNTLNQIENTMLGDEALEKIETISKNLASLKESMSYLFSEKEKIEAHMERLNKTVDGMIAVQNKGIKTFFAFEQLQNAVNSGKPYRNEMNLLKSLAPSLDSNSIMTLKANQNIGIPTIEELTAQMRGYIKMTITTPTEDSDWWDKTKSNMSKVVTVRKQGFVDGEEVDAILARAEHLLLTNQTIEGLKSSLKEIDTLPAQKAEIFSKWIKNAIKVIETQRALEKIKQSILLNGVKL